MALISIKAVCVLQGIRHSVSVLMVDGSNSFKLFFISLYHLTAEPDMALLSALTRLLICVSISHTGRWSHTQCPCFDWRKPKDKAGVKTDGKLPLGSGIWFMWHYWMWEGGKKVCSRREVMMKSQWFIDIWSDGTVCFLKHKLFYWARATLKKVDQCLIYIQSFSLQFVWGVLIYLHSAQGQIYACSN